MRTHIILLITVVSSVAAMADEPSHCSSNEKIFLNCKIEKSEKVVSVCASNDLSEKNGYLQYRFGVPGKIELEYPKTKSTTKPGLLYNERHMSNREGESYEEILKFKIGIYDYEVMHFHSRWWERDTNSNDPEAGTEESSDAAHVIVAAKDKTITLSCSKPYTSHLGDLKKIIKCDKDIDDHTDCINADEFIDN